MGSLFAALLASLALLLAAPRLARALRALVGRLRISAGSTPRSDALLPSGEDWSIAARRLGLTSGTNPQSARPYVRGSLHGFVVAVQLEPADGVMSDVDEVRIRVTPVGVRIELRPRDEVPNAPSLQSGDPAFDRELFVKGSEAFVRAALDVETRRRLTKMRGRLSIRGGDLLFVPTRQPSAWQLESILGDLTTLAQRLAFGADEVTARLAVNASSDPVVGVRLDNLRCLVGAFPTSREARETVRAALEDEDASVRALAAELAGVEGQGTLEALVADADLDVGIRVGAFHLALPRVDAERRVDLVVALASPYDPITAVAQCEAVQAHALVDLAPSVVQLLVAEDESVRVSAARAVTAIGDVTATPRLIALLELDDASGDLLVAACEALGAVGTIEAIPALRTHADRWLAGGRVRSAAATAIDSIRSRGVGAEGGRLSVVDGDEAQGGLSVSADGGSVSVVDGGGHLGEV